MDNEALYYAKPDAAGLEARLLSVVGDPASPELVFDATVFYPEGGGQPSDLGTIDGIPLATVFERDGQVIHRLASPLPAGVVPGLLMSMRLDVNRRRDHTEQHSGQHLLSATLLRLFDAPTKSFHLGPERSTIDIDRPSLGEKELFEAEAAVNEAIAGNSRIITHLCPPEDLASFPLRRLPPAGESVLRVVEIEGIDFTPCCGTHAHSTGELRLALLLGAEKYKGMTRVHFQIGGRAVKAAQGAAMAVREAGRVLGCSADNLASETLRLSERLKASISAQKSLIRARAAWEAEEVLRSGGLELPYIVQFPDRNAEEAMESAKALAERGRLGLAVSLPDLTVCAVAPGPELGLGSLLKPACEASGGRGGGGPAFFRATFQNSVSLDDFLVLVRKNLQN